MYYLPACVLLLLCLLATEDKIKKNTPSDNKKNDATENTDGKSLPAATTNPPNAQQSPNPNAASNQANTGSRIERIEVVPQTDRWFKGYVIFTGVIAAINFLLLIVVWIQRKEMGRQREVMRDQLKAMQGQLLEMKNAGEAQFQANTQQSLSTANIIGQAQRQADALFSLVGATRETATMTGSNVLALMNAERAWIMAEIQWRTNMHVVTHSNHLSLDIFLLYQNDGKTPAWITEVRILFRIIDAQPVKPLYGIGPGDFAISGPIPVMIGEKGKIRAWLQCEGIQEGKKLLVYGFIKYRDVFSPERETKFGYIINQSLFNRIAEIGDSWHYNGYT